MIPTLIAFGLVVGRWWRTSLVVAAVGWPVLLLATDVMSVELGIVTASALAVINTAVGVVAHQAVLRLLRRLRDRPGLRNAT